MAQEEEVELTNEQFVNGVLKAWADRDSNPEQSRQALAEAEQLLLLQSNDSDWGQVWFDLYSDLQHDAQRASGDRDRIETDILGLQRQRGDLYQQPGGVSDEYEDLTRQIESLNAQLIPKSQGLTYTKGLLFEQEHPVTSITTDEDDDSGYYMPEAMARQPFAITPRAIRNAQILARDNPILGPPGGEYVEGFDGETWDMAEPLQAMRQPETRDAIVAVLKNRSPELWGPTAAFFSQLRLAEGMVANPIASAQEALVGSENLNVLAPGAPSKRNVRTADPALVLPYLIPLGGAEGYSNQELEQWQDPRYVRAFWEVRNELIEEGKLENSFVESGLSALGFLGDFYAGGAIMKSVGALAKMPVQAALRANPLARAIGSETLTRFATGTGMQAQRGFGFPLGTHYVRTMAEFAGYESLVSLTDPNTTLGDAMLFGMGEGLKLGALGTAVRSLRGAASMLPGVRRATERLFPRLYAARGKDPLQTGAGGARAGSADDFLDRLAGLPSKDLGIREAFAKTALEGYKAETILRIMDAYTIGVIIGAGGEVAADPEKGTAGDFVRAMASPGAQGTGVAFALSGLIHYQAHSAKVKGMFEELGPNHPVWPRFRAYMTRLATPSEVDRVETWRNAFETWRKQEPELFEGLQFEAPDRRRARQAADALAIIERAEAVGKFQPEALEGERAAEGQAVSEAQNPVRRILEEVFTAQPSEQLFPREPGQVPPAPDQLPFNKPGPIGEVPLKQLETMGFSHHRHLLNAVNKYTGKKYKTVAEVPGPVLAETISSRNRSKALGLLEQFSGGEPTPEEARALRRALEDSRELAARERTASEQLTLEQAARQYAEHKDMPDMAMMPPLEVVERLGRKRARRRISLSETLRRVSDGRMSPEQVREMFPEGASAVGEAKQASRWWGGFEAQVRAAWRAKRSVGALRRIGSARDEVSTSQVFRGNPADLATWARSQGGVRPGGDLAGEIQRLLSTKEAGGEPRTATTPDVRGERLLGPLKAVEGKGVDLDTLAQRATEAGYFLERPTPGAFLEALERTLRGDRVFSRSGGAEEAAARTEALGRLQDQESERTQWKRGLESGEAEMPSERELRWIYEGDPRFSGLSPAQIREQVREIQAEAARGAPEPELAAPEPTMAVRYAQAAENARSAVEMLKAGRVLDPAASPLDAGVQETVVALARQEPDVRDRMRAQFAESEYRRAVDFAQRSVDMMREAAREEARAAKDPTVAEGLEVYFAGVDAYSKMEPIPPELDAKLRDMGMLDSAGMLKPAAHTTWANWLHGRMVDAWLQAGGREGEAFYSVSPFLPFGGKYSDVHESPFGRATLLQAALETNAGKAAMRLPVIGTTLRAIGDKIGGVFSNNFIGKLEADTNRSALGNVFTPARAKRHEAEFRVAHILQRMASEWGGSVPPRSHLKLLNFAMESGTFSKMRGPQDFEKLQKGSGYLYEVARDIQDLWQELGRDLVQQGLLNEGAFNKLAGKYVPHVSLKFEREDQSAELRAGRMPLPWRSRILRRQGQGEHAGTMRITDPYYYLPSTAAQEAKAREFFTVLTQLRNGGYGISAESYAKLDPFSRSRFLPAADVRPGATGEAARLGRVLNEIRNEMQPREDWQRGRPVPEGKTEYSERLDRLLQHYLGGGESPGVYLPRRVAQELDLVVTEMFGVPAEQGPRPTYKLQLLTNWWKRGVTIQRPAHWTLNLVSSIGTNALGHRVPITDFVTSVATGRGFYAEAARNIELYGQYLQEGAPKERPLHWSNADWQRAMLVKENADTITGGTFVASTLQSNVLGDLMGPVVDPAEVRSGLERMVQERFSAGRIDADQQMQALQAVNEAVRRMDTGMGSLDRRIAQAMGDPDPVARARAVAEWTAQYQTVELWFKHAATIAGMHEHPNAPRRQIMEWAAQGTADYRNTSPFLRRWNTTFNPAGAQMWRDTEKHRWANLVFGFAMQGRFWQYHANMTPWKLRSALRHFPTAVGIAGVAMAASRLVQGLQADDPEEYERWLEAQAFTLNNASSPMVSDRRVKEVLERTMGGTEAPTVFGVSVKPPERVREALGGLWSRLSLSDPFLTPTLSREGQAQQTTIAELAPGLGDVARIGAGARNIAASSTPAEDLYRSFLGKQAQFVLDGAAGALELVSTLSGGGEVAGGKSRSQAVVERVRRIARDMAPPAYPGLGAFSRESQHLAENALLGGQPFNEYLAGVKPSYRSESGLHLAVEGLASTIWPSQRIYQKRPLRERPDAEAALVQEILPFLKSAPGDQQGQYKRAQRMVLDQVSRTVADEYEQFFDEIPNRRTLDDRLRDEFVEIFQDTGQEPTVVEANGRMRIREGAAPIGSLARMIQARPIEEQHELIEYAREFLAQPRWRVNGMGLLMEAGRRKEMDKGLFRAAFENALRDPGGRQLLHWIHSQVRDDPDSEKMAQLANVFVWDVEPPSEDGADMRIYMDIMRRMQRAGVQMPANLPKRLERELFRKDFSEQFNRKPVLQGGRAALQEIRSREPVGLERILVDE